MSSYEYHREYRTGGPPSPTPRPATNASSYSSQHHTTSSSSPQPPAMVTEQEYSYSTRTGPGGGYTITKGPYIRVESRSQGPDYRAHLGPRPALGGRRQYTTTTTVQRGQIGGRPELH